MKSPKKILIVEDHPIFAKGLAALLSSQTSCTVCPETADFDTAMVLFKKENPDLTIVDLNLAGKDGLEIVKEIHSTDPEKAVLVLSMHDEKYYAARAIKAGARGYIMKDETSSKVVEAVETVLSGKEWLSENEQKYIQESSGGVQTLSDRQLQIFKMIGKGLGTIEIAAALNLSKKTIDAHKENIKSKLNCGTSQDLRELAVAWNAAQN